MPARGEDPAVPAVQFTRATSLALALDFDQPHPTHFGAPAATSTPFCTKGFEGSVARGASCNCSSITVIPHCHGTHTESAGHLTTRHVPLHRILPVEPVHAMLVTVPPTDAADTSEDTLPAPRPGDRVITRERLLAALEVHGPTGSRALLLRTGTAWNDQAPPCLSRQLAAELVAMGIVHLVTDLPSVDRLQDQGLLTAHRIFFGLPPASTRLEDAARPEATITELASFPQHLQDGPCAVQIQVPAWSGDAVPSRPLHLPLVTP